MAWLRGGNTFMLRYALYRCGADAMLRELLAADALVYAGYSAGACVLSPSLRRLELVDDADAVTWAAQSHGSGISPRPLVARCHPCPGTLRCRQEYRCAGPAGRTDDRAHMARVGAAGHRR